MVSGVRPCVQRKAHGGWAEPWTGLVEKRLEGGWADYSGGLTSALKTWAFY